MTANKFIKTSDAREQLLFCLLNLYQENMRMRPRLHREKISRVTLPALVNLSKCLYDKQLTPLPMPSAENSAPAWSDSLALTKLTRLS